MKNILTLLLICLLLSPAFCQQPGSFKKVQKISETSGNLGPINSGQCFGSAVAYLGDINNDGYPEVAVGGMNDGDYGSIFILSLKKDGTVNSKVEIAKNKGGFSGDIGLQSLFGISIANLGDLDKDNVPDIAVGERDYNGIGRVWILFLKSDGTVKSSVDISSNKNGFNSILKSGDYFGSSVIGLGDLDKDGVNDLAVGAMFSASGGAVYILFLKQDGTVKSISELNNAIPALQGKITAFGSALCNLTDYNHDGILDIAVGDIYNGDGGTGKGAVFITSLNSSGSIVQLKKISDQNGNFSGYLSNGEYFGSSITNLGDINGDSIPDITVGAIGKTFGNGSFWGKAYILLLKKDATVKNVVQIDTTQIKFHNGDRFGWGCGVIKDLDGDKVPELGIGAIYAADGGSSTSENGALYICFLNGVPQNSSVLEVNQRFQSIDIYPNPSKGDFTIHVPQGNELPKTIEIYTITGQLVYVQNLPSPGSEYIHIQPGSLLPGTYIVKALNNTSQWHDKIVIR